MNNDVGRDRFASEEYINKSDKIIANDFQERLSLNQSQAVSVGLQNDQKSDCANDSWSNLSDSIPMNHISEQFDSLQIEYVNYKDETQMQDIMRLIEKDLSEPYSIYTYRYFIHNWPQLCFLAMHQNVCIGAIVGKLEYRKQKTLRGYIAMLAVDERFRKRKIGSNLVLKTVKVMIDSKADEVVLETEVTNKPALMLYENLGFIRDKRLFRYYLNGVDALRLKLWLQ
ncbi:N-alpha-acetyltransferase 30 [Sarcoptes scabiei]|uniref:N-terminal methionine N(alpha)-acetyltransferase NatC n=1 Tax=Sarcoptes scabiei TaxID=52283 RepID=A0A132AH55_SARSC|nr:N-alpha-acetyltransferase 30 [Sarcoptes scabiei]KPM10324.1 Acyltransferase-like protein 5 [Sarcoptes scabiei]UXI16954.1 transcription initiation factor [Sarcoptes scabiei]